MTMQSNPREPAKEVSFAAEAAPVRNFSGAMAAFLPSGAAGCEWRLTDLKLADAMNLMKRRCFGLAAAVSALEDNEAGVAQLADDFADEMKALAEGFEAERQLRIAEGRS
jgi:hypothetical protein